MNFTTKLNYNQSKEKMLQTFTSKDYFVAKYEALGNKNVSVISCDEGNPFSITVDMEQPVTIDIPGFAKKFMGEFAPAVQTDIWQPDSASGNLNVDLKGNPAKISADMRLEGDDASATLTMDWTIKVPVPLIGGKLEKLIGEDIKNKCVDDEKWTNEYLA